MKRNVTNPSGTGLEFTFQFLLLQIVDSDSLSCSDEEEWFTRVKTSRLGESLEAAEGVLCLMFAESVDCDGCGGRGG